MPKITDISDSQTTNVTSKTSTYSKDCGVVATTDASKPFLPTVAEMRKSQAVGNLISGSQPEDASDEDESTTGDSFPAYLGGRA